MVISLESSIEVIGLGSKVANIYCNRENGEHSKLLDDNEYTVNNNASLSDKLVISFRSCNLKYLPQKFLEKFMSAEEIEVAHRGVKTIKSKDFRGNGNLKKLLAEYNELTQLPAYLFNYTPKIEEIIFSNNKLEKIDPNAFAIGVENLKKIDLSRNQIKVLDGRLFINAVSLTNINLELNEIEYFGLRLFKFNGTESIDSYKNSSLNCMILPYKGEKLLSIDVFQLVIKSESAFKLNSVEINCDIQNPYLYSNGGFFSGFTNIDGVDLNINY